MHRHQWIIFLPNFILYRDFTSRYISYRIVYSVLVGAGHIYIYICVYVYIYICMYVYVCVYICVHVYMYIYACECMLLCIHDYMYVFYVCSFYVYWFYDVFYLWLLGQRWPNKEVQTNNVCPKLCRISLGNNHGSISCQFQPSGNTKVRSTLVLLSSMQKYMLDSLNRIHIWQVSPQLSCGNTCQI